MGARRDMADLTDTRSDARPGAIKSAIRRWLGVPVTLKDHAFWSDWTGVGDGRAMTTPDTALQISTVWACVRLISQTIASLPLFLYRRGDDGRRTVARDLELYTYLHSAPNRQTTAVVFWESVAAALLLRGVAYIERLYFKGRLTGLQFLYNDRVDVQTNAEGIRSYRYVQDNGTWRDIPASALTIIPGFTTDGRDGLSVIAYAARVLGSTTATNSAAESMMASGMRASGFISSAMVLSKENRTKLRESLREFSGGGTRVGGVMLLEGGISYTPISLNAEDAQLLQTRSFNVSEICRWFGVPPHMVGHTEGATSWGSGLEQQTLGFIKFCLTPWLRRIEQAVNTSLIAPGEPLFAEFELGGLMRGDSAARANLYASAVQNGWMTRREVRDLENLPMHDDDDVLTVQSNLVTLDRLVNPAPPPAPAPVIAPAPDADADSDSESSADDSEPDEEPEQ